MNRRDIEAIYPLTEMQQGFLLRHLRDPEQDDGFLEVRARFEGRMNASLFSEAWARVVDRHEALRSSVHWPSGKEPLRIVHGQIALPPLAIETESAGEGLYGRPASEIHSGTPGFAALSGSPSPSGSAAPASAPAPVSGRFSLHRTPTWHLRLVRERDDAFTLVWTCHHVLVDGWSAGVVLDDLVASYNRLTGPQETDKPRPPAYAAYLRWLKSRDVDSAQRYWAERFEAFSPHRIAGADAGRSAPLLNSIDEELDETSTKRLIENGRSLGVPMGTLVQAAWALAVGRVTDNDDVCFGLTVSGRPAEVPGIESMAGMFMNALPVRVRIDPAVEIHSWLRALQTETQDALAHGFAGPATLQTWAGVSGSLFDSLLVFENYRSSNATNGTGDFPGKLRLAGFSSGLAVGGPIALGILPGERLQFELRHDPGRVPASTAHALLGTFRAALEYLSLAPSVSPGAVLGALPLPQKPPAPEETPRLVTSSVPQEGPAELAPPVDAPTTPTELRLSLIVSDVLSTPLPGIDEDFFDLGGDSMSALRLLGRIEQEFGRAPSIGGFLSRPTVRALADAMENRSGASEGTDTREPAAVASSTSLVCLNRGGPGRPLFLIHAGGGHVLFYHGLARRFSADRPVYGLQAVGLDGREAPLRRVEDMAERYIAEIRSVQPAGPYALAGLCFGDLVGLEMARRLMAEGETVEPLVMLDSAPYHLAFAPPRRRRLGPVEGFILRIIRREWSYLSARLRTLRSGHWTTRDVPLPAFDETNPRTRALIEVLKGIREAEEGYRPKPFAGRALLVRTTDVAGRPDKAFHVDSWTKLALGGLSVETFQGGHVTMFERPDETDRLAAVLRSALRDADTREET